MARNSSHWLRFWAVGCGALVVALVGAALFSVDGVARHERLSDELRRVEVLNDRLESDNVKLRREVHGLRHDPQFVKRVIRDELGWVRQDEVVFIVPVAEEGEQGRSSSGEKVEPETREQ